MFNDEWGHRSLGLRFCDISVVIHCRYVFLIMVVAISQHFTKNITRIRCITFMPFSLTSSRHLYFWGRGIFFKKIMPLIISQLPVDFYGSNSNRKQKSCVKCILSSSLYYFKSFKIYSFIKHLTFNNHFTR